MTVQWPPRAACEKSHDPPVGACGTHTAAGRYHGDTSVAGFSEGDWPHSRSDQRIWTGSQDVKKNKLATKLPPGVTHPKVGPRQLLRVEKEIYGLVSGPSWLRASLKVDLLVAGYVKNLYDKCLFTLFSSDGTSEGQLWLDVDAFIEGGKKTHRKIMEGFYDKYRCGKAWTSCRQDKVHGSPGDVLRKTPIFSLLCRWTNMSSPSSVPLKF